MSGLSGSTGDSAEDKMSKTVTYLTGAVVVIAVYIIGGISLLGRWLT